MPTAKYRTRQRYSQAIKQEFNTMLLAHVSDGFTKSRAIDLVAEKLRINPTTAHKWAYPWKPRVQAQPAGGSLSSVLVSIRAERDATKLRLDRLERVFQELAKLAA